MSGLVPIDAKIVNKRSTVTTEVPTIPASDDHTDGTWSATDVYSGEIFVNEADKKIYIRIADEIKEFSLAGGGGIKKDVFNLDPAGGGETIFTTSADISGDFEVFEGGVISTRTFNKTDTNEITATSTIPAGTVVTILY